RYVHGFFDGQSLNSRALHHVYRLERANEVPHDIHRVRAVINEDAAAGNSAIRVPALRHGDVRHEGVFEQDDFAENTGIDDPARSDYVFGIAEFRGHGEGHAVFARRTADQPRGFEIEADRLFT